MKRATSTAVFVLALVAVSSPAQVVLSVDRLDGVDPGAPAPASRIVIDVFADVAATDTWTAAGLRATTSNGAVLVYGAGTALVNPSTADRFVTCLSKPLARNADARFNAAQVAIAGRYDPTGATAVTTASEVNVTWFASPPVTSTSPSVDGYVARVAIDISGVPNIDPATAGVTTGAIPPGTVLLLTSQPSAASFGTVSATFDVPTLSGINWRVYASPTNPAPALTTIAPTTATAGGASFVLTATGSGFVLQSQVQWNGSNLATTVVSSSQLTATVPAANIAVAGSASVRVNTPAPGGGNSAAATFTINNPVPTATSSSPSSIAAGSGPFSITVNGTNFNSQTVVTWNGANLSTTFLSATQVQASVPAANVVVGAVANVNAVNPTPGGGTSASLAFTVNNPAPTLTSTNPTSAIAGAGAFTLTVVGTNYNAQSAIRWDGVAQPTTFISATQLSASIPSALVATAGLRAVTVFNPTPAGGSSAPVTLTVNNPVPTAASISPASTTAGSGGFTLVVTGTNFNSQSLVTWNGSNLSTSLVSATQLHAAVPAGNLAAGGAQAVRVVNPAPGGGTTAPSTFTVNNPQPALTSLAPTSVPAASAAFTLNVTGTNFNAQSQIRFDGVLQPTTFIGSTQLSATIAASLVATAGTRNVAVDNPAPGGGLSGSIAFAITNPVPTATSIGPSSTLAGSAAFTLSVTGMNFNSQSLVTWDGANLTTSFISATQLQANVPAPNVAVGGLRTVRVVNPAPGGGTSAPSTFTVNNPVPAVVSSSPTTIPAGSSTFPVLVIGSGFTTQSEIRWNGVAQATAFINGTQLVASIPGSLVAGAGTANVQVHNPGPGGGDSVSLPFVIVGPSIAVVTPASITIKTLVSPPTTLSVFGGGYVATSKVFANGVQLTTSFVSAGQLTAQLPATIQQTRSLGGIWIAVETSAGVTSNFVEVVVGGGMNHGTVGHVPLLDPVPPGIPFSVNIEGCAPSQPFFLLGDASLPAPVGGWPTPAADMVLSVGSGFFVILDGIGTFGPPLPWAVTSPTAPGNSPPGGAFVLPGLMNPSPPLGLHFTLQTLYLDPTSPLGFRLTWGFVNTSI